MKLLFTIVLLMTITQLIQTKPLEETTLSADKQLWRYYYVEANLLAGESCLKLKNITEAILADNVIDKSASHLMQEFRKNVTKFQDTFPIYFRFGHNETLLRTFSHMIKDLQQTASKDDKDLLYIQQLLENLGLNEMREKYVTDFRKLLPKLENFKPEASDKSLKKWINALRECLNFECYLDCFQKHVFTSKDHMVGFLQKQLVDQTIFYIINSTIFAKRMLTTQQLSQLSPSLRANLKENIEELLQQIDDCEYIYQLFWLPIEYDSLIAFYIHRYDISLDELRVLLKIINDQGYEELMSDYRTNYDRFLQYDVPKEYNRLKAVTSEEELLKETDFWNTFEKLQKASTFQERVQIVNAANKKDFAVNRI